jgi:hypothetical protein
VRSGWAGETKENRKKSSLAGRLKVDLDQIGVGLLGKIQKFLNFCFSNFELEFKG